MKEILDSRLFVFLALIVVLATYTVLSLNGSDVGSLNNAVYILIGALAGVTTARP